MITEALVYEWHIRANEAGMRFNPRARIDQSQTEHRSSGGGGRGGGRLTIGGVLVLGAVFLVNQFTGVDISALVPDDGSGSTVESSNCRTGVDANASDQCAIDLLTTSVQAYWASTFPDQAGDQYQQARTVTFSGSTSSGCGAAQAAMGPFYCPNDSTIYIDTSFKDDMLVEQLGAEGGTFALAYVVAHEYGHHVQNQLKVLGRIRTQQGARSDSVKTELMADCLGGMWAGAAESTRDSEGTSIIEGLTADDIDRAIDAAKAVGDDRIQQRSGGTVNEETWTHGSSAARAKWFNIGLRQGDLAACNTFAPGAV